MRIVSQDGRISVPAERYIVSVHRNVIMCGEISVSDCCYCPAFPVASYSDEREAMKAMELFNDACRKNAFETIYHQKMYKTDFAFRFPAHVDDEDGW